MERFTIDLRSDTVTKPTPAMRKAMSEAIVGDDVMKEDPTIIELQNYAAELFGMESALFVPSGTMGNLAAIMSHCYTRGQELILGDLSHIHLNEQGGAAQLAGVHHRTLATNSDGTLSLQELESKIRSNNIHYPKTGLFCLENTHNYCGGTVLTNDYVQKAKNVCQTYRTPLHMDGARIMNAAVYLDLPVSQILGPCDSVSVCLSKGLGAPAGTILAGGTEFIERAWRSRKALGGGMRQSGILAAAGLIALKDMSKRLNEDHCHARMLATEINKLKTDIAKVDMSTVQTNMVFLELNGEKFSGQSFCDRLYEVNSHEIDELGAEIQIKAFSVRSPNTVRFVFHSDINPTEAKLAVDKISYVLQQADK